MYNFDIIYQKMTISDKLSELVIQLSSGHSYICTKHYNKIISLNNIIKKTLVERAKVGHGSL